MKRLFAIAISTALLVCIVSHAAMAKTGENNLYTTQMVDMYNQPNAMSSVLQQVPAGSSVVTYLTEQNGFTNCLYNKGSGWIATSCLSEVKDNYHGGGALSSLKGEYDVDMKLAQRAKIYSEATMERPPIATLEALSTIHVISVNSGWANITAGDIIGYVPTCYIREWNIPENYPMGSNTWYGGYDWSAVYNYEHYKGNNPEVVSEYGEDELTLIQHFVEKGMSEGRRASASFDVNEYIAANDNLYRQYGDNLPVYYKDACGIPY